VFISHACADTGLAEQVCRWLVEDGHRPFLDRDRDDGVLPGEEWEKRLYRELRNADAVVCVVTAAYLKSKLAFIGAVRPTLRRTAASEAQFSKKRSFAGFA